MSNVNIIVNIKMQPNNSLYSSNQTKKIYVFFCLVFAMSLRTSVDMSFVVTSWERAGLLALVCGVLL